MVEENRRLALENAELRRVNDVLGGVPSDYARAKGRTVHRPPAGDLEAPSALTLPRARPPPGARPRYLQGKSLVYVLRLDQ